MISSSSSDAGGGGDSLDGGAGSGCKLANVLLNEILLKNGENPDADEVF